MEEFEPDQKHQESDGASHLVNNYAKCPVNPEHKGYEVRNYRLMFQDGDVHCAECGAYIRMYDAG